MPDPVKPTVPAPALSAEKKQKDRSPSYPAISLPRALEHAQKLWDTEKRQAVMVPRAVTNLGFSTKSSGGLLAVAAMKKYGLLDDEGNGDARKVKLTDAGIALLNPSAANRDRMLKEAALRPPIHSELWEKFGGGASDGAIHDYLVFDRGFNEQAATTLIGQFRDTISFAKVQDFEKSRTDDPTIPEPADEPMPVSAPTHHSRINHQPTASVNSAPNLIDFPVPLPSGAVAYFRLPPSVSEVDFNFYQALLTALKPGIVKAQPPKQVFPCEAIWRTKDHDQIVSVTGEMGIRDGILYYQIRESQTGIPASQLKMI